MQVCQENDSDLCPGEFKNMQIEFMLDLVPKSYCLHMVYTLDQ